MPEHEMGRKTVPLYKRVPKAKNNPVLSRLACSKPVIIKTLNQVDNGYRGEGQVGPNFLTDVFLSENFDTQRKEHEARELLFGKHYAYHITKRYRTELKKAIKSVYDEDVDENRSVLWATWNRTYSISWAYRNDERDYFDVRMKYFADKLKLEYFESEPSPSCVFALYPIHVQTKRNKRQFSVRQCFRVYVGQRLYKDHSTYPDYYSVCKCDDEKNCMHYNPVYHPCYQIEMWFEMAEIEGVDQ